jgi:hypothetical protein
MSTTMNSIKRFTVFLILFHLHKVVQQTAPLYGTCDIDKDCKKNSFCYGNNPTTAGKCKCLEGFTLITLNGNVQCIKGKNYVDKKMLSLCFAYTYVFIFNICN